MERPTLEELTAILEARRAAKKLTPEKKAEIKAFNKKQDVAARMNHRKAHRELEANKKRYEIKERKAEVHAQKVDPNYQMADRPIQTKGYKAYNEYLNK